MKFSKAICSGLSLRSDVRDPKEVLAISLVIANLVLLIDLLIIVFFGSELFDTAALTKIVLISTALYWMFYWLHSQQLSIATSFLVIILVIVILGIISNPVFSALILGSILPIAIAYRFYHERRLTIPTVPTIVFVFCLSGLFAVYNLASELFVYDELIQYGDYGVIDVDHDWLQNIVFSYIYHTQGVMSSGLHGVPSAQYYPLPYIFYSFLAHLSGLKIDDVFMSVHAFVLSPFLLVLIVYLSALLVPCKNYFDILGRWLFLLIIKAGIFNLWPGFLFGVNLEMARNSKLIGFLFLFIFVISLVQRPTNKITPMILIILLLLTKLPLGLMALVACSGFVLHGVMVERKISWDKVITVAIGATFFIVNWYVVTEPAVKVDPFYYNKHHWGVDVVHPTIFGIPFELLHYKYVLLHSGEFQKVVLPLMKPGSTLVTVVLLFVIGFSFYWQALVALLLPTGGQSTLSEYKTVILVVAIIGFPFLSMAFTSGAHKYFAVIASVISMPVLISLWSSVKQLDTNGRRLVKATVTLAAIGGVVGYLQMAQENISKLRAHTVESMVKQETNDRTWLALKKLGKEKDKMDYLVYIPTNQSFWDGCGPLDPLRVSVISKRASLYGLKSCGWGAENYYGWGNMGFQSYSPELFEKSMSINYTEDELCQETLELGFSGFFTLNNQEVTTTSCIGTY